MNKLNKIIMYVYEEEEIKKCFLLSINIYNRLFIFFFRDNNSKMIILVIFIYYSLFYVEDMLIFLDFLLLLLILCLYFPLLLIVPIKVAMPYQCFFSLFTIGIKLKKKKHFFCILMLCTL